MTNNLLVLGAEQINDALNGKESEIIEIVKNTYLFHNEGKLHSRTQFSYVSQMMSETESSDCLHI